MADSDIIIRVRTDGITGAETALKRLGDAGVRTEVVTDSMAKAFERNNKAVQANTVAMQAMQTLGMVTFIAGLAGGVTKLADSYTNLTNKLVNANTANENLAVVQQRVFDIAQRSRTGLEETTTLYARLERSLVQYGATASQIARITETVSKAMIVSGATTAEANAAIIQLSQGLQSGVLRGDEFRSVAEQAPRLLKAMSDSLGVTTGELRAMANQGQLTADVVAKAINGASDVIDKEFSRTVATFEQKLTIANNNMIRFAGTTESVTGTTSLLGDGIVELSEHMDTVATVIGILATAFTGRLITAMVASQAASLRVAAAQATEIATAKALTSARVQDAAAAVQQAQATIAVAEADKLAAMAAVQAGQAYYKGVASLTAYYQAKNQATAATIALNTATATLNTTVATATARATAMATAVTGLRAVMSLLGGPAGIIMLAVSALVLWNQQQDAAIEKARQLGADTDTLRDRLQKMTTASQQALQVELQRAAVDLEGQLAKEKAAYDSLQAGVQNQIKLSRDENQAMVIRNSAVELANKLSGDAAIQNGKVSETQQQLDNTRENLRVVTENLAEGERGLKAAVEGTNAAMNLATGAATQRSDALVKALQAQNAEADVATLKLNGNARAASQLADVQNRMPKVYAANKEFIDDLIAGHAGLTTVMTNEQLGIKEFIDAAGVAYDAQQKLRDQKTGQAQTKRDNAAAARYSEQWDKAYERVEARGATALDRLRIQQDAEIRAVTDKANRANATEEQLGNALVALDSKYARERQKVADSFNPAAKIKTEYEDSLKTIDQLQRDGLLNDAEIRQARLNAESEYLQQKMNLAKEYAVSEREQLMAEYDPVLAAQVQYEQELAMLTEAHDLQLIEDDRFYDLRHQKYTEFLQNQAMAQNQEVLGFVQSTSTMAGSFASILQSMGDTSSATYKTLFAMSKGFAIAEASIKLTQAMVQAMADPTALTPMQKFANYAAVASAGASLISQITSATMQGMAHDGITEIPKEGTWLLQKGERVLSAQQNADFTNFMRGGSSSGGSTSSGGNVTQYITVSGAGDQALADAVQRATADGAEQGYSKVLLDVSNRGNVSRKIGR